MIWIYNVCYIYRSQPLRRNSGSKIIKHDCLLLTSWKNVLVTFSLRLLVSIVDHWRKVMGQLFWRMKTIWVATENKVDLKYKLILDHLYMVYMAVEENCWMLGKIIWTLFFIFLFCMCFEIFLVLVRRVLCKVHLEKFWWERFCLFFICIPWCLEHVYNIKGRTKRKEGRKE